MARCESIDLIRENILKGKETVELLSDTDSENDISHVIDLDISNTAEDNSPTPSNNSDNVEEQQSNARPVLSVKCLYEDSDEEITSKKDDESSLKFIDAVDVPQLSVKCLDNAEFQVKNVEPEKQNAAKQQLDVEPAPQKLSTVICIPVQLQRVGPNVPPRNTTLEPFKFKVEIDCKNLPKKNESLEFSKSRNKLYVCKDNPFKIIVTAQSVPAGSFIRINAVYSNLEHSRDSVRRCATHAQEDFSKGNPAYEHFIQCTSETAIYEKNTQTGLLSVSVPYEKPQGGEKGTTYIIKLTCFSSCPGGINRRPFTLVFTLEKNNVILGKHLIEAKVCACPSRDIKIDDEKEKYSRKVAEKKNSNNGTKHLDEDVEFKSSASLEDNALSESSGLEKPKYSIKVENRELFEFLERMKILYETGVHISPEKFRLMK